MDYKLEFEDEFKEIETSFVLFFREHHFKLKSLNIPKIVYENDYSELIFDFDTYGLRFGYLDFSTILYKNKSNGKLYTITSMMKKLHNLDFEKLLKEYIIVKDLGFYDSCREIICIYLNEIIYDASFSWAKIFKENYIDPK